MRRRPLALVILTLTAVLGASVSAGSTGATAAGWPTYHLDPGRSGSDASEPAFNGLTGAWTSAALDGALYAEPLVNGGSVIVATENNSVYSFSATTGALQWGPVHLGAPRTSNFPCGDINPLGVTGTPVMDGGWLFVLDEIQVSSTSFQFKLAELDPATGAIAYNNDVTPSGMDPNVQQERSALNVSAGNVVVTYGGLDGDCGNYHGYVETVAESTGVEQHQWNDTSGGREGGMWAPSGAAVDGSGNIYVTTGNGSSSSISSYDYGDSVLKFNSTLTLQSFFAPGSPQTWSSLNANDQDLGSTGPSLLPNSNLLFAIGKGGRGYILNQSGLPSNSNPGGGENFSAAVCSASSNAAYGGMATSLVNGVTTVFVPCRDGIAAVSIQSASSFTQLWYQKSGGGGPPIVAGGYVWTVPMFGGTTMYGLRPDTGAVAVSLSLPATTRSFSTPASGDGLLFMGANNRLAAYAPPPSKPAFSPQGVGAPSVTVDGSQQIVFWRDSAGHLTEAWFTSSWNGPVSHPEFGTLLSAPSAAVTRDGSAQVVFWEGPGGHLMEAWYQGGWNGPVDWTASWGGVGALASAPSVATMSSGRQLVFWRGIDGHLWEAWYSGGWNGPVDWSNLGTLASAPSVALTADASEQQTVFWQGTDNVLTEAWFNGSWNGPVEWGSFTGMGSAPSVAIQSTQQVVFYRDGNGHLVEGWFTGHWNGPADWTALAFHGAGPLTSAPSTAITSDGQQQLVFWQGGGSSLWEAWHNSGGWNGPVDYSP